MANKTVLLTGGSGYIGLHILQQLLQANLRVIAVVRNENRTEDIKNVAKKWPKEHLVFEYVSDITADKAYDAVFKKHPEVEAVIHNAMPIQLEGQLSNEQMVDQATKGTLNLVEAADKHLPSLKRLVITSSVVAQGDVTKPRSPGNEKLNESSWLPLTIKDLKNASTAEAYCISKKLSEEEAWKYVKKHDTKFSLTTIHPVYVYGPILSDPKRYEDLNQTSRYFVDLCKGNVPQDQIDNLVDVRDVARAHVDAITNSKAPGQRWILTAGPYVVKEIVDITGLNQPDDSIDEDKLIKEKAIVIDNSKTLSELGFELRPKKEVIRDFVLDLTGRGILIK